MVSTGSSAEALVWAMAHWPKVAQVLLGCVAARHPWKQFRLGHLVPLAGLHWPRHSRATAKEGKAHSGP